MDTENLVVLLPHAVHCMGHLLHRAVLCTSPHTQQYQVGSFHSSLC